MKTSETVWGKAHDALVLDGWTQGNAVTRDGCMCVGGAIAWAITGFATDLYSHHNPNIELHLMLFGDHVNADWAGDDDLWRFSAEERVTHWNDKLDPAEGYDLCLKALKELHEKELAK